MSGLGSSDHANLGADRERFGHTRLSSVDGALWTAHGASIWAVFDLRLSDPAKHPVNRLWRMCRQSASCIAYVSVALWVA